MPDVEAAATTACEEMEKRMDMDPRDARLKLNRSLFQDRCPLQTSLKRLRFNLSWASRGSMSILFSISSHVVVAAASTSCMTWIGGVLQALVPCVVSWGLCISFSLSMTTSFIIYSQMWNKIKTYCIVIWTTSCSWYKSNKRTLTILKNYRNKNLIDEGQKWYEWLHTY